MDASQVMLRSIRGFYYAELAAIPIVMAVTVTIVDLLSHQLRKLVI
jgi:phosphonate transport system permease protein